jgi:hypothetical protein
LSAFLQLLLALLSLSFYSSTQVHYPNYRALGVKQALLNSAALELGFERKERQQKISAMKLFSQRAQHFV